MTDDRQKLPTLNAIPLRMVSVPTGWKALPITEVEIAIDDDE